MALLIFQPGGEAIKVRQDLFVMKVLRSSAIAMIAPNRMRKFSHRLNLFGFNSSLLAAAGIVVFRSPLFYLPGLLVSVPGTAAWLVSITLCFAIPKNLPILSKTSLIKYHNLGNSQMAKPIKIMNSTRNSAG